MEEMSNFREAQELLKQAKTPQEREEALRAFKGSIPSNMQDLRLVTLSHGSQNNSVKLGDVEKHSDDPEVFERLKNLP